MNDNKEKELETLKAMIIKTHGKGSVITLNEIPPFDETKIINSGSISLDIALGIGGYARGRVIEIFGPEMSGKTTLALHAIAQEQANGGTCAFIDTEHSLDVVYAGNLGVSVEDLLLAQPNWGEQALDIVEMMARSGTISLIVIDSVAALTPKAEIEGEMGDASVGAQARLMSKAMRKLVSVTSQSGCSIMFTNQIRMKIGVMFGSPETTTGGNALKFYASQRLDIRRIGKIEEGTGDDKEVLGNQTRVKVVKNKLAPPFRQAHFDILYGHGIDTVSEILDLAVDEGLIKKAGAWFSLADNTRLGQGKAHARAWLRENPEKVEELTQVILQRKGLVPEPVSEETE
jgi:recombination protein RecA